MASRWSWLWVLLLLSAGQPGCRRSADEQAPLQRCRCRQTLADYCAGRCPPLASRPCEGRTLRFTRGDEVALSNADPYSGFVEYYRKGQLVGAQTYSDMIVPCACDDQPGATGSANSRLVGEAFWSPADLSRCAYGACDFSVCLQCGPKDEKLPACSAP